MRIPVRQSLAIAGALAMVFSLSDPIVGAGGTLVRDNIHSSNFVSGTSGWQIQRNGNAEFNNVTIRGQVVGGNVPGPHYVINGSDAPHGIAFYTAHANESFPGVIQPDSSVGEATIGINGPILDGAENPGITLGTTRVASGGGTRIDMAAKNGTWSFNDWLLGNSGTGDALSLDQVAHVVQAQSANVVMKNGTTNDGVYVHDGTIERFIGGTDEIWHEVGTGSEPAFTGTWTNFGGAGVPTAAFYKDASNRVQLKGRIKDTAAAANPIFTLPVGYRPAEMQEYALKSNNDAGTISWVQVNAAGQVNVVGNVAQARVSLSLNQITFLAVFA